MSSLLTCSISRCCVDMIDTWYCTCVSVLDWVLFHVRLLYWCVIWHSFYCDVCCRTYFVSVFSCDMCISRPANDILLIVLYAIITDNVVISAGTCAVPLLSGPIGDCSSRYYFSCVVEHSIISIIWILQFRSRNTFQQLHWPYHMRSVWRLGLQQLYSRLMARYNCHLYCRIISSQHLVQDDSQWSGSPTDSSTVSDLHCRTDYAMRNGLFA